MNRQLTLTFRTLAVAPLLFFWIGDSRAQDSAVPVTVAEVMTTRMAPRVPAAGTVFSRNATQVTAGIAGRLEWVAEPGDLLNAGQPVARFDCEMLELQRERQVAEADRADINHKALAKEALTYLKAAVEQLRDPKERFILKRAADLGVDPAKDENRSYPDPLRDRRRA